METAFSIIQYLIVGFIGFIGLLFVLALLFGKRVKKAWEFDADFLDENGREIGEFDIELSKVEKEETVESLKAKLRLRHSGLQLGDSVEVVLEGDVVATGVVEQVGRIHLTTEDLKRKTVDAREGQRCEVRCRGVVLCAANLVPD